MLELIYNVLVAIYDAVYEMYYEAVIKRRLEPPLMRHSLYYRSLGKARPLFRRKVWEFIRQNEFVGREQLKIKISLKTIIAAHAVQLSFRLPEDAYSYYDKIILYKDYYLSTFTRKYHKGEVNPGLKVIVFSIRAIYESIEKKDDGLNVLIHEFAHALWLEHMLMHRQYRVFEPVRFDEVRAIIRQEMENHATDESHFFRRYAFANEAEFFAVATENLFERPAEFKASLPALHKAIFDLFDNQPYPELTRVNDGWHEAHSTRQADRDRRM